MVFQGDDLIETAACNLAGLNTHEANSRQVERKLEACITEWQVDKALDSRVLNCQNLGALAPDLKSSDRHGLLTAPFNAHGKCRKSAGYHTKLRNSTWRLQAKPRLSSTVSSAARLWVHCQHHAGQRHIQHMSPSP
jgi:hypothetical protein